MTETTDHMDDIEYVVSFWRDAFDRGTFGDSLKQFSLLDLRSLQEAYRAFAATADLEDQKTGKLIRELLVEIERKTPNQ
jgi:hypothetical protein